MSCYILLFGHIRSFSQSQRLQQSTCLSTSTFHVCCKSSKGNPVTNESGWGGFVFVFLMTLFPVGIPSAPVCLSQHVHFCILVLSSDQSCGSPEQPIPFGERKQGRQQVLPYFVVKAWHSLPSSVRHGSSSTKRV